MTAFIRTIAAAILAALGAMIATGAAACSDLAHAPSTRWQVERAGGAAWLRDPCGNRLFSIGVNVVTDQGIDDVAAWLPRVRDRFAAWGFNTVGGFSLPPAVVELPSLPNLELGRMARYHWLDPFDPDAEARVMAEARELTRPYRGTPYRIGYYSDNEVGWWNGALFNYFIKRPHTNHTKQRLIRHLRDFYGDDWQRFSADFIAPLEATSFEGLLYSAGQLVQLRPGGRGIDAVRGWTRIMAGHYYATMRRAIRAADPEALYFGDRLPIFYDPEAIRAAVGHVDAISTNYNVDAPDGWLARYFFDGLRELAPGVPILISEWFFAAHQNRSGNTNNSHLMTVATQAQRARGAAAAMRRFAANPDMIGVHWFQYRDYPTGGRPDGEDYNFGLVDLNDRPYRRLVGALGAANRSSLERRHRVRALDPAPGTRFAIPRAAVALDDKHLADWPKDAALVPGIEAGPGEVPFGDYYLAWNRDGLALASIGMDYYDVDLLTVGNAFPLSEAYRIDIGVDAGAGARRFRLAIIPPELLRGPNAYVFHSFRAELCAIAGDDCRPVPGAVATYFGADQPRVTVELQLPWAALGLPRAPVAGRDLRIALASTAFYRSRWMSWGGAPPDRLMAEPVLWQSVPLAR